MFTFIEFYNYEKLDLSLIIENIVTKYEGIYIIIKNIIKLLNNKMLIANEIISIAWIFIQDERYFIYISLDSPSIIISINLQYANLKKISSRHIIILNIKVSIYFKKINFELSQNNMT